MINIPIYDLSGDLITNLIYNENDTNNIIIKKLEESLKNDKILTKCQNTNGFIIIIKNNNYLYNNFIYLKNNELIFSEFKAGDKNFDINDIEYQLIFCPTLIEINFLINFKSLNDNTINNFFFLQNNYPDLLESIFFIYFLLNINGKFLQFLSSEFQSDEIIVLKALKNNPSAFKYASKELKNNKEFLLVALKENSYVFQYISKELKNNKEFILVALKENSYVLEFVPSYFKHDEEIVLEAITTSLIPLSFACNSLRNNKEFLTKVINKIENNI